MRLERLVLSDFRNYEDADVALVPGLNLVVGRNAQGKTNLLEAVHCLAGMGSPRGPDSVVVREASQQAVVHGMLLDGARRLEVDLEIRPGRGNRAMINRTPVHGLRALTETVVSVFFGPDELSLVKGSPDGRRRFLDDLAVRLRPARHGLRQEWERVMKQRNALLKSAPAGGLSAAAASTLEVWNASFARVGGTLTAARLQVLASLLPFASKRYEAIAGGGRLDLGYVSGWLSREVIDDALVGGDVDEAAIAVGLRRALEASLPKELERRMSLVGPQRDDVGVSLADASTGSSLDVRDYASQGDQRTAALALKLGEFDLLNDVLSKEPVLLLDDVFSELDPSRRKWLADAVRATDQTILTSAEPGAVDAAAADRVIEVVQGKARIRG